MERERERATIWNRLGLSTRKLDTSNRNIPMDTNQSVKTILLRWNKPSVGVKVTRHNITSLTTLMESIRCYYWFIFRFLFIYLVFKTFEITFF